jgi:hypothetical protein
VLFRSKEERGRISSGDGSPSQFNIFCTWPSCRPGAFHIEGARRRRSWVRRASVPPCAHVYLSFVAERVVHCLVFIFDCHSTRAMFKKPLGDTKTSGTISPYTF